MSAALVILAALAVLALAATPKPHRGARVRPPPTTPQPDIEPSGVPRR